ncbi:MAG: hypothetical protein C4343_07815 [Chloroflexota bacterium]
MDERSSRPSALSEAPPPDRVPVGARRRPTVRVDVGGVPIGSGCPIVVQSMTNTDTADADATALQVARLAHAGSELVRVTVNTEAAARAVPEMVRKLRDLGVGTPIVGDFHYNGHRLLVDYPAMAKALAKYRVNPGNVGSRHRDENFATIVRVALEYDKPIRIGVNAGSLDKDIYALSPEELKNVPHMPGSLEEALDSLERDHDFLLRGDVFTEDVIDTWLEYKWKREVDEIRLRPHPWEFYLYFDL